MPIICCLNKNGFFKRNGYTPTERKRLFYGICVPVRIVIGILVMYLLQPNNICDAGKDAIVSILIIVSGITIINTLSCLVAPDGVWWNRKFEMLISIIIIIMSGIYLSEPRGSSRGDEIIKYLCLPIFIDIIYGLVLSTTRYGIILQ